MIKLQVNSILCGRKLDTERGYMCERVNVTPLIGVHLNPVLITHDVCIRFYIQLRGYMSTIVLDTH